MSSFTNCKLASMLEAGIHEVGCPREEACSKFPSLNYYRSSSAVSCCIPGTKYRLRFPAQRDETAPSGLRLRLTTSNGGFAPVDVLSWTCRGPQMVFPLLTLRLMPCLLSRRTFLVFLLLVDDFHSKLKIGILPRSRIFCDQV